MEIKFDITAMHRKFNQSLINIAFWPNQKQYRKEIVRAFQEIHDELSDSWTMCFQIIFVINALILCCLMYAHYTNPWGMKSYGYFKEEVEAEMVMIVEMVAAVACVIGFYGFVCDCNHKNRTLIISISIASLVTLFWFYYLLSAPKLCYEIIWLPMTPLGCCLASAYVVYLLAESQDAIDRLRAYTR